MNFHKTYRFGNSHSEMHTTIDLIAEECENLGINPELVFKIKLSLDELATNIIKHGFELNQSGNVEIYLSISDNKLNFIIIDDAKLYNPLEAPEPNLDAPIGERKAGGLGVFLVKQLSQKQVYSIVDNKNHFEVEFDLD